MIFDRIIGHQAVLKNLTTALTRPPHAFLFCGPSGIGKKLAALGWAQGLLCQGKNKPCGRCPSCQRVEKRQHPDLFLVETTEATLKIETIRDVQNFISLKAFEGQAKVVIIDEAHMMTAQASNSLLKTLEEPPENSFFVLVTSNRGAILQTIQSRCQRILFGSLTPEELKKIVSDVPEWICHLAGGSVEAAQKLNDEEFKELRGTALRIFRDLPLSRTFEGFMSIVPLVESRETALFSIHCWSQWIKECLALRLGAHAPVLPDEKETLEKMAASLSTEKLMNWGERILKLEQDIRGNINKTLAFENFWMDAREDIR